MKLITPGTIFLAHHLLAPSLLFTALLLATRVLALPLPTWLLSLLTLISVPLRVAGGIVLQERRERLEAEAMGARMAPRPEGKTMGNIDLLKWLMKSWKEGYPGDGLRDLVAIHGPVINLRFMWTNTIFTVSPECIKTILTDTDTFIKGEGFRYAMGSVLGNGVFNSDGDMWKFHRSMTRPFFSRDRVRAFELFDRHAAAVVLRIREKMQKGEAVDFQDLMHRFTLDSGTDFLFGSCVNSLQVDVDELPQAYSYSSSRPSSSHQNPNPNSAEAFSTAFLHAQQIIADRERLGWVWPILELWGDKTEADMKVVNGYLEKVVEEAVSRNEGKKVDLGKLEADGEGEGEGGEEVIDSEETLLDHLVGITSDPALLKDEILNILIAARDTMAATLTFTIYFLSQHPDVTARLRTEILDTVGATHRPTYEDVKKMRYLKAVINECLRLLPPVPYNVRSPVKSTTWPSPDPSQKPIYIPKGSETSYGVIMMHTRKDLWGPDADVFDPDRFLDERLQKYLLPNPFIFLPFNAGPRICLGQQFAYNQISFILIRLLQTFSSVSLCPDAFPPNARPPADWATGPQAAEDMFGSRKTKEKFKPKIVLTMSSEGGMWVKMREE